MLNRIETSRFSENFACKRLGLAPVFGLEPKFPVPKHTHKLAQELCRNKHKATIKSGLTARHGGIMVEHPQTVSKTQTRESSINLPFGFLQLCAFLSVRRQLASREGKAALQQMHTRGSKVGQSHSFDLSRRGSAQDDVKYMRPTTWDLECIELRTPRLRDE